MTTGRLLAALTLAASVVQITLADHAITPPEEQPPTPNVPRAIGYYDRRMQRVMMIGGATDFTNADLDKVWSWSTTRWELLTPAGPPSRSNGAAAFDATAGRGVIAGGAVKWLSDQFRAAGDTWLGDGMNWRQVPDHPARDHHSMVTDGRGQVLMFGGIPAERSGAWPTDTWELKDGKWLRAATEGPPGRARTAMAYDSKRRQVVLFGGVSAPADAKGAQTFLNDTWIWESGKWRKAAESGPRGRYAHGMVFDERAGAVVLYGGAAAHKGAPLSDMWQWDGAGWSEIKMTGPTPGNRYQPLMVYDVKHEKIVLYGGLGDFKDDTWEWDGKQWIEVRP